MIKASSKPAEGTVECALWRFALVANKRSLHSLDWRRFYRFIAFAHARRIGWDARDIKAKLRAYGFNEEYAKNLASAYWHGRCALFMNLPRLRSDSHCDWMRRCGTAET
jgi:hypothetical protein